MADTLDKIGRRRLLVGPRIKKIGWRGKQVGLAAESLAGHGEV